MTNDLMEKVHTEKTDLVNPIVWKQMKGMAKTMIESRAMPAHIQNEAQAIVVMQMGYEMGMKPMQAINSLYIVNGQVTVWGKAIAAQFIKHGYRLSFKDEPNKTTVTATHRNGFEATETFTFEEAEKSGYTKSSKGLKFGWREGANRNLKLRYNALNKLAKTQCPEVLGTAVGITEVYQDTANDFEEGEVIVEVSVEDQEKIKSCKTVKDLTALFGELSKTYGVKAVKDLFSAQRTILEQEADNENL